MRVMPGNSKWNARDLLSSFCKTLLQQINTRSINKNEAKELTQAGKQEHCLLSRAWAGGTETGIETMEPTLSRREKDLGMTKGAKQQKTAGCKKLVGSAEAGDGIEQVLACGQKD